MRRAPLMLLGAGALILLAGCAALLWQVNYYLTHPLAISSTSGLSVYTGPDGSLVSYDFFQPGLGANLITAGGVLVFASLFLLAVLWRRRVSHR